MRRLRRIFDDWITRAAGIVFVLILALVVFNIFSNLPEQYPLFGVFNFSMVPILFIVGGIIFVLAILNYSAESRDKLIFLMSAGAAGIALLVVGGYQLVEFTDSVAFCGQLCHQVMYPEYTAYQASPHSRVACAQCHVGSGADYLVRSKISGIPLIYSTITGNYDRPIPVPVANLRPARETCEQCHRPERFTGDLIIEHTTYAPDEQNTSFTDTRILRVGGGQSGIAQGIHWHIATTVYYLPLDHARQDIAWVSVQSSTGQIDYLSTSEASQVTPESIKSDERLMDCIDCHNRATHQFNSPDTLLDNAFVQGQLDTGLPYLKRQAIRAMDPPAASLSEAYTKVAAIRDFYSATYPDVARDKAASIDAAIATIDSITVLTTFPYMHVTWKTYTNNVGHQGTPGCFRCHGKLVAQSGPQKGQTLSADCTLCHYFSLGSVGTGSGQQ